MKTEDHYVHKDPSQVGPVWNLETCWSSTASKLLAPKLVDHTLSAVCSWYEGGHLRPEPEDAPCRDDKDKTNV